MNVSIREVKFDFCHKILNFVDDTESQQMKSVVNDAIL